MFGLEAPNGPRLPLKVATSRRKHITLLAESFTLTSAVFSILVLVGNTRGVRILDNIYFLRIDVSNIIPRSFPNYVLVNSIAQTLGLRDFYQVGLWNYCEGYKGRGVTYCSPPKALYSFDPVEILLSQLLDGATIAIPATISNALDIAKMASHWMFTSYFIGIGFAFVALTIGWIDIYTRWNSLATGLISFVTALFTTVAAAISTALFIIFQKVFEDQPDFNIQGTIGTRMFVFMWMASGFSLLSFILHAAMCCCTMSRRRAKKLIAKGAEEHAIATDERAEDQSDLGSRARRKDN